MYTSSDDENRRWNVTIKHVALVDLETVIKYCRPNEGTPEQEEECQTGELGIACEVADA